MAEGSAAAVELGELIEPTGDAAVYEKAYAVYRELYPALKTPFKQLGGLDSD